MMEEKICQRLLNAKAPPLAQEVPLPKIAEVSENTIRKHQNICLVLCSCQGVGEMVSSRMNIRIV